jgi:hypothetical protein
VTPHPAAVEAPAARPWVRPAAAALFLVGLAVWTWKLLEPNPVPESVFRFVSLWDFLPLLASKILHVLGYAVLTALAWVAAPPGRWRWAVVGFLLLHGVASEVLQHVLPFNRTGKVSDVLIDWAGIALGILAARRYFPNRASETGR